MQKKNRAKIGIVTAVIAILVVFPVVSVLAQEAVPVRSVSTDQAVQQQYEFLKEQVEAFRKDVAEEKKDFMDFIKFLLGVGVVVIGFFGWKSRKDIQENTELEMKKFRKNLEDGYTEEFNNKLNETGLEFKRLTKAVTDVEKVLRHLGAYKESQLMLVGTGNRLKEVKAVLKDIDVEEFKPIKTYENALPEADDFADNTVVVFGIDTHAEGCKADDRGNYTDDELKIILDRLEQARKRINKPIPIIIYTPVARIDSSMLTAYKWHTYAQTPATLVNTIYTMQYAFHKMQKGIND